MAQGGRGSLLAVRRCRGTTVLPCRVLWARLDVQSIGEACEALRKREQIATERQDAIGVLVVGESPTGELAEWASARQLDAVIWTALPPRLGEREGSGSVYRGCHCLPR